MNHLEFAEAETKSLQPTAWERWASKVESELGHSLDGDQANDGYSLDGAHDAWASGQSVVAYSDSIKRIV